MTVPAMRASFAIGLAAAIALSTAVSASAQEFPSRTVTIIVPTGAGGAIDMVARLLAPRLEQRFSKPVIVENRPGAGTNIGATAVARSAPDGHTLLMATSSTMAINASIYGKLPFDPQKDLVPLVLYAQVPFVLVVNAASQATTAADLVRLAKEKPGALTYGSAGIGTASHLFAQLFRTQTGIDVAHVPYKSTVQPLNDILGGHLHFMFSDLAPALPLVQDGKLRALGVTTAARVETASAIPTLAEAGAPGYEAAAWLMIATRAGTSPAVLDTLHTELKAAFKLPEIRGALDRSGMIAKDSPAIQELSRFVETETTRWARIVKDAGAAGIE